MVIKQSFTTLYMEQWHGKYVTMVW